MAEPSELSVTFVNSVMTLCKLTHGQERVESMQRGLNHFGPQGLEITVEHYARCASGGCHFVSKQYACAACAARIAQQQRQLLQDHRA